VVVLIGASSVPSRGTLRSITRQRQQLVELDEAHVDLLPRRFERTLLGCINRSQVRADRSARGWVSGGGRAHARAIGSGSTVCVGHASAHPLSLPLEPLADSEGRRLVEELCGTSRIGYDGRKELLLRIGGG
jgi:hypothetical protein